ncbi:MAG: HAD hydrolase-like protein [Erysipelotrichaceae bacterium]|nr:HAD hydrolase-like protein [Erysipelotrichaceae bacterium]
MTVLFDLDGTISDSSAGILKSVKLGLDHFGQDHYTLDELRVFIGPPLRDMFPNFGVPEDKVDEAIRVFREYYNVKGKYENTPYDGIEDMLKKLKDDGIPMCIATSKPEKTSIDIIKHFGFTDYFAMICGATFDESRESKQQVLEYLMHQCDDSDFLMIGDTQYDVIGANSLGIKTIGVSWGFGTIEEMEAAGAVAIAHTPEELYNLIHQYSEKYNKGEETEWNIEH